MFGKTTFSGTVSVGATLVAAAAALASVVSLSHVHAAISDYADPPEPALPASDMQLDLSRTALVVIDPQVDFLSPEGVTTSHVANRKRFNEDFERT